MTTSANFGFNYNAFSFLLAEARINKQKRFIYAVPFKQNQHDDTNKIISSIRQQIVSLGFNVNVERDHETVRFNVEVK